MSTTTATKPTPELVMKAITDLRSEVDTLKTENAELKTKAAATPVYNVIDAASGDRVFAVPRDQDKERAWGFQSFGEFALEVQKSISNKTRSELITKQFNSEMVKKAALGMGELVGSDGGFLVPPQFSDKIFERVYKENELLKRTDQYTVGGNSMVFPRNNESSRANGSRWGGVRAYWVQEGGAITRSAPTFGRLELILHKVACLGVVTEELLADSSPAMDQYLNRAFPSEISFVVGDSLIRGTGAGQPLGIKNAPCTVTVTRTTAGHVVAQDIVNMWARRFTGGSKAEGSEGYVWYVNQDVSPDLYLMTLGIGTAGIATYMPPGGLSGKPYATLMGAPVIETEWNDTLGTSGDIILGDLSQMVSINKGGMNSNSSMHLYFDTDQQAFKVTFRVDARPWWATPLTPFKGTATQSPFVLLS